MGEPQHRTGCDLSVNAARRGDGVFTCGRLTRWRQTTVAHKVPTLASSFLRDSMLNLLAVQAVDVRRQPCSDPRRHHVPLWRIAALGLVAGNIRLRTKAETGEPLLALLIRLKWRSILFTAGRSRSGCCNAISARISCLRTLFDQRQFLTAALPKSLVH